MLSNSIIEMNKLYPIVSTETGKPYMDEDRKSIIYLDENEAEEYVGDREDIRIGEPVFYKMDTINEIYYANGVNTVIYRLHDEEHVQGIVRPIFYRKPDSHEANGAVSMLKETKLRKHLADIVNCEFIVPAKIKDETKISYCIVKHAIDTDSYMYIGFTDIDEYALWSSQASGWKPLMMRFEALYRIAKDVGIMLNPLGNRCILSKTMLAEAVDAAEEERVRKEKEA